MNLHFGQVKKAVPRDEIDRGNTPGPTRLPSWVPPPWMIPLIDKNQGGRKGPQQPRVYIEDDPSDQMPYWEPPPSEKRERGVDIIQF
jgi:hypothetical protein